MSIVESVVDWCEADTILFKSALMPGTVDRLVEKTGKDIAVSVEHIGMGNYYMPPHKYPDPEHPEKHNLLIIGGQEPARTKAANILWSKMSPDVNIHLVTAMEAEIVKLMENTWGAYKVTFANVMFDICEKLGANYINVLQAWGADGRVEKMHMRTMPNKRGWQSHCYSKDIPALATLDDSGLLEKMTEVNKQHLKKND
jgi:UDPglucose 6-dehydrogenase